MLAKFANFVYFCITLTIKRRKFNFKMLFLAGVKAAFFVKMKIQFKREMVHYDKRLWTCVRSVL